MPEVKQGLVLVLALEVTDINDLWQQVNERLDRFAPKAEWSIDVQVYEITAQANSGEVLVLHYRAEIYAKYTGSGSRLGVV